ncbi:hypothetical protein HUT18_31875 [Streptomyces sp. NA04227]|uniref:hypothetical protein n=1 Tax=Streptomyces sp. NA04227 TaxID=2742136 RepID=UPI00159052CF|nr:hypothetical protein [Streptomyces sp. NA04227]QKW10326.1 hypothetical protein HUT18_31875 [Streptomyces sp. NA04227]
MAWQAPVVVMPPAPDGERRILLRGRLLGTARSDTELVTLLLSAGLGEADVALDDRHLVEWRGAPAHLWQRAS